MSNTPIAQVAVSTIKGSNKQDIYPKTIDRAILTTNVAGTEKTLDEIIIKGITLNGENVPLDANNVVNLVALMIKSIATSESQTSGGSNTVTITLSDDSYVTLTIKNGINGVGFESISSPVQPDGTATITLSNGDTVTLNLNHNHDGRYTIKKTIVNNTDASVTLSSDVIYNLGTVSGAKTISLPSELDNAADYECRFVYSSGSITLPEGVTVANNNTLTFTQGKTYHIRISGGILYFSATTVNT